MLNDNNRKSNKNYAYLIWTLLIVLAVFMLSGCGSPKNNMTAEQQVHLSHNNNSDDDFDLLEEEYQQQMVEISDPLEPLNRAMFGFNDVVYFWVVKPVTSLYKDVTPEPARISIRNFFQNVTTPVRLVNCLIQGKGDSAGRELHRFAVNTTEGILGFGDPAKDKYGIAPAKEDLGQSLAVLGMDNGFYLVLPLFGPSTLRDAGGKIGDYFLNPVSYIDPDEAAIGVSVLRFTNAGSFRMGEYESLKSSAVDPYIALRDAYIQFRNKQIQE
jgi:phospholipid-binding lipoprotein MlaA